MAEVTVTLQDIKVVKEGRSAKGDWILWEVKGSDGRRYKTFKRALIEDATLLKNQLVVISYDESQNGEYTNYDLTGIRKAPQEATGAILSPTQPTLVAQSFPGGSYGKTVPTSSDKDTSIARAVAFKGAVELAAAGVLTLEGPESVLDIAEAFTPWLLNTQATASPPPENPFADLSEPEVVDAKGELVKF